jgi:small-conductance mechanosensitive channel
MANTFARKTITRELQWLVFLALAGAAGHIQGASDANTPAGTWFMVEAVNPSLPKPNEPPNLATPQACVEHFTVEARRGNWASAARALHFRLIGPVDQDTAAQQARRLRYLMNQNLWVDWSQLPDRPDGTEAGSMLSSGGPMEGTPRRSIQLGTISLNGRAIPVRVERVKAVDSNQPVWLFAAQTVENIDRLWDARGPSWLARQAPEWSRQRLLWRVPLWQWLALLMLVVLSLVAAWLVVAVLSRRVGRHLGPHAGRLVRTVRWPAGILVAGLVSYSTVGSLLTLPGPIATVGSPLVLTVIILSATWLAIRVLAFFSEYLTADWTHKEPTLDERGTLVRLTIFRYVLIILVVAIGLSVLLISIDLFRVLGIALLGSAGAAAVVLGLAGHAVLGNLIAGLQIALARPFRIGDTVIVEGYWGVIEELRYTYVAVRTWDKKRVIFPVRYFLNNWFENWSKTDPFLTKPIYLKVDYRADVQAIREKFFEIVHNEDDWAEEQDEPEVLVTECGEETMTVRLTCGAADPPTSWKLICRVREKTLAWLQEYNDGRFLPRQRVVLHQRSEDKKDSGADEDVEPQATSSGGDPGQSQSDGGGDA